MSDLDQIRDLDALDPRFRGLFVSYLDELQRRLPGYTVIVTETRRTPARQELLREQGLSKTLHSNHLLGRAVDIALLDLESGKLDYDEATFRTAFEACPPSLYGLMSGGLEWGWDWPHLEPADATVKYPHLIGSAEDVWLA